MESIQYISNSCSNECRFGFNGKENDNEVYDIGNWQDYGMRMYNPRIGRFPNPDPLFKKYPELTTYQFSSNSPIQYIDLDGLEGASPWAMRYAMGDKAYESAYQSQNHILVKFTDNAVRGTANTILFVASVPQVVIGNIAAGGDRLKYPSWGIPIQINENWDREQKISWMDEEPDNKAVTEMLGNTFSAVTFFTPISQSENAIVKNVENFVTTNAASTAVNEVLELPTKTSQGTAQETKSDGNKDTKSTSKAKYNPKEHIPYKQASDKKTSDIPFVRNDL
ncbi:MAG: hypothetical protein HXX18_12155 [Bacteroidetes bacterium]|nr:hypothetical protein [Bacteroidota bacterium]